MNIYRVWMIDTIVHSCFTSERRHKQGTLTTTHSQCSCWYVCDASLCVNILRLSSYTVCTLIILCEGEPTNESPHHTMMNSLHSHFQEAEKNREAKKRRANAPSSKRLQPSSKRRQSKPTKTSATTTGTTNTRPQRQRQHNQKLQQV